MAPPTLSIIIPTLNEEKVIERTVRQFDHLHISHEVVVADGWSEDDTLSIASLYCDRTILVHPSIQNAACNRNRGAQSSNADFLVFIDADEYIPYVTDFFIQLLGIFSLCPNLVALTVHMEVLPGCEEGADSFMFWGINRFFRVMNNLLGIGAASGGFQMVRREAFERIGGYNEFLAVGEDNDLFYRLSKIGETRSIPYLCVYNTGRRAHKVGWAKLIWQWMGNAIYYWTTGRSKDHSWEPIR